METTLQAAAYFVIVEPQLENKRGSIVIPDTAQRAISDAAGIVISVGPDYPHHEVKPGDLVYFRKNEGTEIYFNSKKYLSLKKEWVLARVEA